MCTQKNRPRYDRDHLRYPSHLTDEGNQFVWPGYDLRKLPGRSEFHYGFLPPRFFDRVLTAARAYCTRRKMTMTTR
jgi:hypothetical protein